MMDIRGLAALTGYKVSTLRKMTSEGKIPYYRNETFRRVYYDENEIEKILKTTRIPAVAELVGKASI